MNIQWGKLLDSFEVKQSLNYWLSQLPEKGNQITVLIKMHVSAVLKNLSAEKQEEVLSRTLKKKWARSYV